MLVYKSKGFITSSIKLILIFALGFILGGGVLLAGPDPPVNILNIEDINNEEAINKWIIKK